MQQLAYCVHYVVALWIIGYGDMVYFDYFDYFALRSYVVISAVSS